MVIREQCPNSEDFEGHKGLVNLWVYHLESNSFHGSVKICKVLVIFVLITDQNTYFLIWNFGVIKVSYKNREGVKHAFGPLCAKVCSLTPCPRVCRRLM